MIYQALPQQCPTVTPGLKKTDGEIKQPGC
jgi:hypothetical protein